MRCDSKAPMYTVHRQRKILYIVTLQMFTQQPLGTARRCGWSQGSPLQWSHGHTGWTASAVQGARPTPRQKAKSALHFATLPHQACRLSRAAVNRRTSRCTHGPAQRPVLCPGLCPGAETQPPAMVPCSHPSPTPRHTANRHRAAALQTVQRHACGTVLQSSGYRCAASSNCSTIG